MNSTPIEHECPDWDFLVIRPGDPEMAGCTCFASAAPPSEIPTSQMMHAGYDRLQQPDLKGRPVECYECGEIYKAMRAALAKAAP